MTKSNIFAKIILNALFFHFLISLECVRVKYLGSKLSAFRISSNVLALVAALTIQERAWGAEAHGEATVRIVSALAMTTTQQLDFAAIVPNAETSATVTLTSAGERKCGTGLTCSGPVTPAAFLIQGTPHETFSVTLPQSTVLRSGQSDITIQNFSDNLGGVGNLDADGRAILTIGAAIVVAPEQPVGDYSGTFAVTVDYN